MVLAEAIRMAEGNSSPINNILGNSTSNSVATAAGIAGNEDTNNKTTPTKLTQPTMPERGILGAYEGATSSSNSRSKAPIYTRDKRTKFTQRENKKWVRLATVLGYLVAVCTPAIALSIYYIGFWDPHYIEQYQQDAQQKQRIPAKALRSQPQQCCTTCNCPNLDTSPVDESLSINGNREARHLSPIERDADSVGSSSSGYQPAEMSERDAEKAYYQHVVVGKNYAIYGALPDDTSVEVGKDSSFTAEQMSPSTESPERMQSTETNTATTASSIQPTQIRGPGIF